MRFCAVLRRYPKDVPGGAEYQAYLICRELARRGHETHYVAHRSAETGVETDDGITVHRLNQRGGDLLDSLEEIGADVYYFRIAHDLPLLWRAKRRIDAKFVYNVSRDVQCRPLFAEGPYQDSKNIVEGSLDRARYAVYRFLLRVPDEIFAQSKQQQKLLQENHSLQSTVIGNGHPVPDGPFEKESPPVVLWLASLKQVKNPGLFLDLVERTEDLDCQFWIVGRPVEDEIHRLVRQKTAEHEELEYLGGCGILESNEYFSKAAVYVHTGDSEGFPNTFIQSWLHSTPVISFCTDPDAALENNNIGAHCESVEEAESALREFIEDEAYRLQVGSDAREYGIAQHSIEVIVDRVEQQFKSLIEGPLNTDQIQE